MKVGRQLRNQALSSHSSKTAEGLDGQEHPMKVARVSPKFTVTSTGITRWLLLSQVISSLRSVSSHSLVDIFPAIFSLALMRQENEV